MPNYQESKIYKLVSNISDDIYIGSTVNRLSHRLNQHKNKHNSCVSKNLFTNDAVIQIILIEMFPCNNKIELKAREHHYITTLKCINKHIPFVTDIVIANGNEKEWNKVYNASQKDKYKAYNILHAVELAAKRKDYNILHAVKLAAKSKAYKTLHAVEIAAKRKDYNTLHAIEKSANLKACRLKQLGFKQLMICGFEALPFHF